MDETNLFSILRDIVLLLEDGHVNLYAEGQTVSFDFTQGQPTNQPTFAIRYLENTKTPNNSISFSRIKDYNLGYVRIFSFVGEASTFELIDEILKEFKEMDGIVVDVRSNQGGGDQNAKLIASRFADEKRLFRKVKFRNGPEHTDFTDWQDDHIGPSAGGESFRKPVVVLTNKGTYSAAEGFILAMKIHPHIQTVGGVSGGGSGNPIIRELPNGWYFGLSHWIVSTPEEEIFEGIGIQPDHAVSITEADKVILRDALLEKAIELLD